MTNLEFCDKHNIVNWEYILLGMTEAKDSEVCKITRADGSSSFHGDFQALLRRLDREDLSQLYSLVQERFKDHPLEGHNLDLWGDLRMIFDPNEEDDIWLNQHHWELLRWKLHEYSGVHSLFLDGTSIQINMLVDKKYPLKKEILKKMINLKIEAEEESTMAHELIKFIKSQIAEQREDCWELKSFYKIMLLKDLILLVVIGKKTAKSKPTTHKDQAFNDLDDFDAMDYMETEDDHNEKGVSTADQVSTAKPDESTNKPKVSTDKIDEGTAKLKNVNLDENTTPTATPIVFRDDETIAEFLVSMSQNKAKQKGVEIKDAEDSDRPRPTLTRSLLPLKLLPKFDPKDKGKKVLEEEAELNVESEGVNEVERKFAQLANDEEISRKVQEEWETEEEKKKLAKEEATKVALIRDYKDIQARIEADSILAARLQEEEREKFTIEERAKLLHDTIVAQRRFLAQQRVAEIRSRPPTRTQLRNQMMKYLKHVKRSNENFIAIGSAVDKRLIKDVNKKAIGIKKDDNIKEESKEEEKSTRKRKLGTRKKMKLRKRRFRQDTSQDDQTDSEKENDKLRLYLTIATDKDKEFDETKRLEEIDLNVVIRSNRQRRYVSTLIRVLSIFDREDINAIYQLVMDKYQDEIPEGFDRVLWGDLMIMFNPSDEDEF
ncbi:hypothetical protein Tco_0916518 [Tanacetum coccineum]